jgi:hypothetical protein
LRGRKEKSFQIDKVLPPSVDENDRSTRVFKKEKNNNKSRGAGNPTASDPMEDSRHDFAVCGDTIA